MVKTIKINNKKYFIKKKLSQIFLKDINIIESIINTIQPQKKDLLVEIGPGFGALTNKIIKYIDIMHAIELDKNLFLYLKNNSLLIKKVIFYNQDVMKFNFFNLKNKKKKLRIFGNLPYNISTKILFYLSKFSNIITDMHFMFQKEVANRLVAQPNCKNYGRLSVMAQYFYNIYPIFNISSKYFLPQPKVDSTLLKVTPKKNFSYQINYIILNEILKKSFNKRRKMLRNSLKEIFSCDFLNRLLIDGQLRAENISVEQYCKMTFLYEKEKNNSKKNKLYE